VCCVGLSSHDHVQWFLLGLLTGTETMALTVVCMLHTCKAMSIRAATNVGCVAAAAPWVIAARKLALQQRYPLTEPLLPEHVRSAHLALQRMARVPRHGPSRPLLLHS
jgi:hypothetical protein